MRSRIRWMPNTVSRVPLGSMAALVLTFSVAITFGPFESARAQPAAGKQATAQSTKATPLNGQKLAESVCSNCHGPHGNATIDPKYPKIAGQKYTYLLQQLHAFKSGTRKSDVMSTVLADIANAQLAGLARWYSRQSVKKNLVKDHRLANLGARVFNSPGPDTPSCAACHSARGYGATMGRGGMMGGGMMGRRGMMGSAGNVPRLSGQNVSYTVQQLDDFASGKRRGTVMNAIVSRLPAQYRRAVAEYLSGLR